MSFNTFLSSKWQFVSVLGECLCFHCYRNTILLSVVITFFCCFPIMFKVWHLLLKTSRLCSLLPASLVPPSCTGRPHSHCLSPVWDPPDGCFWGLLEATRSRVSTPYLGSLTLPNSSGQGLFQFQQLLSKQPHASQWISVAICGFSSSPVFPLPHCILLLLPTQTPPWACLVIISDLSSPSGTLWFEGTPRHLVCTYNIHEVWVVLSSCGRVLLLYSFMRMQTVSWRSALKFHGVTEITISHSQSAHVQPCHYHRTQKWKPRENHGHSASEIQKNLWKRHLGSSKECTGWSSCIYLWPPSKITLMWQHRRYKQKE